MIRRKMKIAILSAALCAILAVDAKSNGAGLYAVNPIQFSQPQNNNYQYQPQPNYGQQPNSYTGGAPPVYQQNVAPQTQQHGSNQYSDHFLVTQVKSDDPSAPQPIPYHHPAPSYKHGPPFNGQPFVIEPSYLLKPYRPPQNFQPQPYQTPVNQHQVFHPVTYHQTPSYPIYQATVYQQPQYQGQVYQQSPVYQPPVFQTVYSSVALLYSTPVLAYSTQLSSFEPTHSQVPAVVSSAVRPVVETAAPSALYADVTGSSDANELDKRYVGGPSILAELVYIPKTVASLRSAAAAGGKAPENSIEYAVKKDESATSEDATQRNQTYAATENKETKSISVDYNKESSETTKTVDDPVTEISLQEEVTGDSGEKTVEQVSEPSSYKEEGGQKYGASVDSAGAAGTEEPAEKNTSDESDETTDEPAKSEAYIGTEATTYENPKEVSQVTTDEAAYVEPEVNKYAANDSGEKSDVAKVAQEEVTNYKEPSYQQESSLDAGSYTSGVDTTNYVAEVTVQKEEPAYQEAPKPIIVEEPNAVAAKVAYKKEEPETFRPFYRLKPVIVEAKMMTEPEVYQEAEEDEETVDEIQTPEVPSYPKGLEQVNSALYASVNTVRAEPAIVEEEEEDETEKPEYKNPLVYPNDYAVITKDVGLETYVPIEMVEVTSELPSPLIFRQDYTTQDDVEDVVLDAPVENVEASSSLPEVELPKTDDTYIFVEDFAQDTEQVTSQTEEVTNAEPVDEVEDEEPVTKYDEPIFYPEEPEIVLKIEKIEPVIQQIIQKEEPSYYQVPVVVAEGATEIPAEKVEPEIDVSTDIPVEIKEEPVVVESVYIKEAEKSAYITESLTSEVVGEAVEVPVPAVIAPAEKTESYATKTTYAATADKPAEYTPSKQDPAERRIKLKIHNLNVEHLMDERYQTRLFDVFRSNLWPDCSDDLHLVEIVSALAVGGRRPARLADGEGVIVTLGTRAEFSETMRELEREVSSLWPLKNCPRDFKKTSAERHFRSKGFMIDWCSFKLIPQNSSLLVSTTPSSSEPLGPSSTTSSMSDYESQTGRSIYSKSQFPDDEDIWRSPAKWETPTRSYLEEGVVAVFLPIVLLLILAGLLTAILGVHPEGAETEEGQLYESVFEELPFVKPKPEVKHSVYSSKDPISSLSRKSIVQAHDSALLPQKQIESATPSLNRITNKRTATLQHEEKASNVSSSARGSIDSPFLMSVNSSHCPTPVSTLSRNTTIQRSTLGSQRPQPPPYTGTLPRNGTLNRN